MGFELEEDEQQQQQQQQLHLANSSSLFVDYNKDEYTSLLTELHEAYCKDKPDDVLQYCANFFYKKLEEQRSSFFHQEHSSSVGKIFL